MVSDPAESTADKAPKKAAAHATQRKRLAILNLVLAVIAVVAAVRPP